MKVPGTILVTGGSGLIGRALCFRLKERGFNVAILSRYGITNSDLPSYTLNIAEDENTKKAIASADYIIHLAGANIGENRWTAGRKQEIIDSRVKTAQLIFNIIKTNKNKLKAFISASATGYYGAITSEKIFNETDPPGSDFLSSVCKVWEQSANNFEEPGIRVVKIRTGIVLTGRGGALGKMSFLVKLGLGSALGAGNQYLPWIHIDDLCNIYIKAIKDSNLKDVYNAVAPEYITNNGLIRSLSHTLKKPLWFPNIPEFFIKLMYGEMADMILNGSRVSCDKIKGAGYVFLFPELQGALENLLIKK